MLIKNEALPGHLKKKTHGVYLLIGNDPYLLNDAARHIKQHVLSHHPDAPSTTIDLNTPADWTYLFSEANTYSLFSDVVLLDARLDKKSMDPKGREQLIQYLKHINDRCIIVLRAPLLTSKSLQWFIDSPNGLLIQSAPLSEMALTQWIARQFQSRQIQIKPSVDRMIQQYTQGNMLAAVQLIEKLALGLEPNERVTPTLVKAHLSDESHFELYELSAACLNANALRGLQLLQNAQREDIEPMLVLWVLSNEIRLLIKLHQLLSEAVSIDNACQQLKIWSSRTRLYAKATSRLSIETLYGLLRHCRLCDDWIKTSQTAHLWNAFQTITLSLSGAPC